MPLDAPDRDIVATVASRMIRLAQAYIAAHVDDEDHRHMLLSAALAMAVVEAAKLDEKILLTTSLSLTRIGLREGWLELSQVSVH
jgi:hypothetical protein